MYQVKLHRKVSKQLARFPKSDQKRIAAAIRTLSEYPRPENSVHLQEILYRLRVGQYRVIYAIFEESLVVVVVKTARRSEATYKDLNAIINKAKKLIE